jgi:hypothetical protein
LSLLDGLCVEKLLGRFELRLAGPPVFAGRLKLLAQAVGYEQRIIIVLEFAGREQVQVPSERLRMPLTKLLAFAWTWRPTTKWITTL